MIFLSTLLAFTLLKSPLNAGPLTELRTLKEVPKGLLCLGVGLVGLESIATLVSSSSVRSSELACSLNYTLKVSLYFWTSKRLAALPRTSLAVDFLLGGPFYYWVAGMYWLWPTYINSLLFYILHSRSNWMVTDFLTCFSNCFADVIFHFLFGFLSCGCLCACLRNWFSPLWIK